MKICTHGHMFIDEYESGDCPIRDCNGHIFECDDVIAPAVIELNRKGIHTIYSCSSHFGSDLFQMYIAFEPRSSLSEATMLIHEIISTTKKFTCCMHNIEAVLYLSESPDDLFSRRELTINFDTGHPYETLASYFLEHYYMHKDKLYYTVTMSVRADKSKKIDNLDAVVYWVNTATSMYRIALKLPNWDSMAACIDELDDGYTFGNWIKKGDECTKKNYELMEEYKEK